MPNNSNELQKTTSACKKKAKMQLEATESVIN